VNGRTLVVLIIVGMVLVGGVPVLLLTGGGGETADGGTGDGSDGDGGTDDGDGTDGNGTTAGGLLNVTATPLAEGEIRITFDNVYEDADEYVLRRGRQGYGSSVLARIPASNRSEYSYTDSETNPGTSYYYDVVPMNGSAQLQPQPSRANVTADGMAPSVVSGDDFLTVVNRTENRINVSFEVSERLQTATVGIDGPESERLQLPDFAESNETESGGYVYSTSLTLSSDGNYTASVVGLTDFAGNTRRPAFTEQFRIDNRPPEIRLFNATRSGSSGIRLEIRTDERLGALNVSSRHSASSSTRTLSIDAFERSTDDGTFVYVTTYDVDRFGVHILSLETADDTVGNGQESGVYGEKIEVDN